MRDHPNYQRTKLACYIAYFTMSSVFCVPPLLFITFRELYGISYTLLGALVLINFGTQVTVDLLITFFSKYFNTKIVVRVMPVITTVGLLTYALIPALFPSAAYFGLVTGTVLFSVSAGLSEVLLSPTIAAIPSKNPQRDMSTLHSLYAFGVFFMVVFSTLFLRVFGQKNWIFLVIFLAALPMIAAVMFMLSPMPEMSEGESTKKKAGTQKRGLGLALCVACIFFGSCAENTMSNWISGFMENALGIDKVLGDVLGVAMFAILLGMARIAYAKFGKRIFPVLVTGMIGASVCYLVIGLSSHVWISFAACILTGLFTAMLWPGSLLMMEEKIPSAGVAAFALMASGGDLGAAFAPQLMGILIDRVSASEFAVTMGEKMNMTAEQIGMKTGMLCTALFPILGVVILLGTFLYFKRNGTEKNRQ